MMALNSTAGPGLPAQMAYGFGQIAGQVFRDVPSLLLLFFMTSVLGVSPALAGTAAGLSGALSMALGAVLSTLTALVVERSATPGALLAIIMGCVLLSLVAALVAIRLEGGAVPGTA